MDWLASRKCKEQLRCMRGYTMCAPVAPAAHAVHLKDTFYGYSLSCVHDFASNLTASFIRNFTACLVNVCRFQTQS